MADFIRVKFARFERMLDQLEQYKHQNNNNDNNYHRYSFEIRSKQAFRYLNYVMSESESFNQSWKWIFSFVLLWRFIIINIVTFVAVFYEMSPQFQLIYRSVFVSENVAFLSIMIQVSYIHLTMNQNGKRLRQIQIKHQNVQSYRFRFKVNGFF